MEDKTILVVDDEPDILKAMSLRLKSSGYNVITALDASQAVMMAQKHNPDLIMLDIRMPGGGGLTVLDRVKSSLKTRNTPVFAISAFSDDETVQKAMECGAARYFKKPFAMDELLQAIEEALAAAGTG